MQLALFIRLEAVILKCVLYVPQQHQNSIGKSLDFSKVTRSWIRIRRVAETYPEHHKPKVREWAKHKALDVIKSGLQPYFTLMDPEYFKRIRNHTNAVEQAANKGYATGKRMQLLLAIEKAAAQDLNDCNKWNNKGYKCRYL